MKVAVIYNRESRKVINLFGIPNRERYGKKAIAHIVDALKKGGHQVLALEGDKDLVDRLEEFMPRVLKGERPGMAFNLSYGIQGQARYTHVPGILEMVGIPYVGSGPLAHSLALDKVVAKMIFRQNGLPTPDFTVLHGTDFPPPDLTYPLIVKPRNEAVSMGLRVVRDEQELREAAGTIFESFGQPVLAEQYIEGREINVGLLGNNPAEPFTPAEIVFEGQGLPIYTYEDKTHRSGRQVYARCPADIVPEVAAHAQDLALRAFESLGCYDCARVDMRLDEKGSLFILEINSLPSLGEHGSYVEAARYMGLDFPALVNRLVEVAGARYFGTPSPPALGPVARDPETAVFEYLTAHRDRVEQRLQTWCGVASRTGDGVGMERALARIGKGMREVGLKRSGMAGEAPHVYLWETPAGMDGGTLLVAHLDVPLKPGASTEPFRRDPEWLQGEGIGVSRAPLVMAEYALRALKAARAMKGRRLGVLLYADEGLDCKYSGPVIREVASRAGEVLVLRPGNPEDKAVVQRRGQRRYRLLVEGRPLRLGHATKSTEPLRWMLARLDDISRLTSRKERLAVAATDVHTEAYPMLLPHRVAATLLVSYLDPRAADLLEERMRGILAAGNIRATLALLTDRPSMRERRVNLRLARRMGEVAARWDVPLETESSLWPSAAGLVAAKVPVVCGVGPVVRDLNTAREAVQRISLAQRTLLLAQFILAG